MPRPKNVIPTIEKTVSLPQDLVARVDLELFSTVEERVPFGAWKGFLTRAVRREVERAEMDAAFTLRAQAILQDNAGDTEVSHVLLDRLVAEALATAGFHNLSSTYTNAQKRYA